MIGFFSLNKSCFCFLFFVFCFFLFFVFLFFCFFVFVFLFFCFWFCFQKLNLIFVFRFFFFSFFFPFFFFFSFSFDLFYLFIFSFHIKKDCKPQQAHFAQTPTNSFGRTPFFSFSFFSKGEKRPRKRKVMSSFFDIFVKFQWNLIDIEFYSIWALFLLQFCFGKNCFGKNCFGKNRFGKKNQKQIEKQKKKYIFFFTFFFNLNFGKCWLLFCWNWKKIVSFVFK